MIFPVKRRRSNIQVIADILRLGQMGKTQIIHSANMSYSQLQEYLDFLTENGFMERVSSETSIARYNTTKDGRNLLKVIEIVLDMLYQGDIYGAPNWVTSTPM
jgi:predicted transcriptional regulator